MSQQTKELIRLKQTIEKLFDVNMMEVTDGNWRFTISDDRWLFIEFKFGVLFYDSILRADLLTGRKIYRNGSRKSMAVKEIASFVTDYASTYYKKLKETS